MQRRVGRWPNRHWLYVEPQADGRWIVEVSGLPSGAVLPFPGVWLPGGRYRFHVLPDETTVTRLFAAIGRAFLITNGEVPACPPEPGGGPR